jgi:hypothetical protein
MTQALDLTALHLAKGSHPDRSNGLCLLEAVAWWAGEPHTDRPACVSPVLADFGRSLNDALSGDRRQELVRFVPLLPGTNRDGKDEARGYLALDWLVRVFTPGFLGLRPGLADAAAELRSLAPVVDLSTAGTAGPVVRSARQRASAAWDAAGAAAWDAAKAAAWDAARTAAGAAARDAAWAAARDAAGAAAWDAAWAAARAAAWVAAWDASTAAAWDAAKAALQPAVDALQASAIQLYAAMINPQVTR